MSINPSPVLYLFCGFIFVFVGFVAKLSKKQTLLSLLKFHFKECILITMKNIFNHSKKHNRIKIFSGLSMVMLSLMLLTGCMTKGYTDEEEAAFLTEAKEVVSDYLANHYSGADVMNIQPETAVTDDNTSYVLTSFASGTFFWQDKIYSFVVSTRTGEVFTSVQKDEIVGRLQDDLLQALQIDAQETQVFRCSIYLRGSNLDEKIPVQNVFPDGETADELYEKIKNNTGEYSFSSMTLLYKGEDLPPSVSMENSPFPTLSSVEIYHIADEYGFVKYYDELACFSSEILRLTFSAGTSKYIRNQVWERDGFQIIYNAYERTENKGTVAESVITEADISLTVTDDYIALDCTKNHFVMYLSAADEEMAEGYLHHYSRTINGRIDQGAWYAYEGRYFYDGSNIGNVRTPCRFTDDDPIANIIYTESGSKKPLITPGPSGKR